MIEVRFSQMISTAAREPIGTRHVELVYAPLSYGRKTKLPYPDKKPKLLLLHSGCFLAFVGTICLGVSRAGNYTVELLPTTSLASVWAALTGVFGICASCWCPNSHYLLDCYTDVTKCRKDSILVCYRIYLGAILSQICVTIPVIIHGAVLGSYKEWKSDSEFLCVLLGTIAVFVCLLLAALVMCSMESFRAQHTREHGQALPAPRKRERETHPVRSQQSQDTVSDIVSLPPPYSSRSNSVMLPTYEMSEAEEPLLESSVVVQNGRLVELPPSYAQVMHVP